MQVLERVNAALHHRLSARSACCSSPAGAGAGGHLRSQVLLPGQSQPWPGRLRGAWGGCAVPRAAVRCPGRTAVPRCAALPRLLPAASETANNRGFSEHLHFQRALTERQ